MIIMHAIEVFLPYDISEASSNYIKLAGVTTQFVMCYFHWWASLVTAMLVPTMNMLSRFLFYDEQFNTLKAIMTGLMIGVWIWFMRMCFVQVGMYYVEAEILRIGNDSLLDNLEEGVII